ncbi:AI-2E family transporter [Mucilaginibacter phyllosphaerae]|uniref:AI-2E family transporter n=1 Tax=Mucilaginibacter phyllosphaerae TaxID=1812349 RepID=A0A4Y8A9P3_9SPHI|nr:AI-2E family transporter [Mucilaginibacter phyllosphaerae]MBB3969765.1 putative PurR-regulated permease PerM [Mucilaginibacter phyllosphaerae]TEW65146.1 AI-2E family transporter [Mucilaginibacter phyllosphaerae]
MNVTYLNQTLRILLLFVLVFGILYFASAVLIPLTFGMILSMLLLPVCHWLQSKGMGNGMASVLSVLALLVLIGGVITLLQYQISDLADDLSKIEERVNSIIAGAKDYVKQHFGISHREQQKIIKEQQGSGMGKAAGMITTLLGSLAGILVDAILVLVYTFLFIFYRGHFKKFILRLFKPDDRKETALVLDKAGAVTQNYLGGLGLMIVMLWIMYGIGFSIAGVNNALFFAVLCGILELVPFAGNITGTSITILMALAQSGDTRIVIGVIITYGLVQLIQTYILEPLVVGDRLNINPLFTIFIIVVGEAVWGIPGMILAVPLLGMFKIVCDHVEPLHDYAFLIGPPKEKKGEEGNFLTRLFKPGK